MGQISCFYLKTHNSTIILHHSAGLLKIHFKFDNCCQNGSNFKHFQHQLCLKTKFFLWNCWWLTTPQLKRCALVCLSIAIMHWQWICLPFAVERRPRWYNFVNVATHRFKNIPFLNWFIMRDLVLLLTYKVFTVKPSSIFGHKSDRDLLNSVPKWLTAKRKIYLVPFSLKPLEVKVWNNLYFSKRMKQIV